MGKHFTACFDKTKVVGGNEGISLLIKNGKSDSVLEIGSIGVTQLFRTGKAEPSQQPPERNENQTEPENRAGMGKYVRADVFSVERLEPGAGRVSLQFLSGTEMGNGPTRQESRV